MNDLPTFAEEMPAAGETPADCIARIHKTGVRKTTPCGDGEMVWHVWGEGTPGAVPVVLCHGNFGSWPHFIRNIPILSKKYALYIPDMPGFGDSAVPPESTLECIIDIMRQGIDVLLAPNTKMHVTGFSYGSTMAGYLARALGDRVLSLCLCGGSRIAGMQDLKRDFINWRKAETEADRLAAHRHNLGVAMFSSPDAVDDLAVAVQDVITSKGRIKPREFLDPKALVPALKEISKPKLTIWGNRDPYYPFLKEKWHEAIEANGVNLALQEVDGAGHWAIYERSAEMNSKLLAWYAENDLTVGS